MYILFSNSYATYLKQNKVFLDYCEKGTVCELMHNVCLYLRLSLKWSEIDKCVLLYSAEYS